MVTEIHAGDDLGVDEDFSEQQLTDLVNTREIYLVPMLNVDGNRYDREEYCGENAWAVLPVDGERICATTP